MSPTARSAPLAPAARRAQPLPPHPTAAPTDDEIHERIVNALLDQRLAPGTRLREDELGQVFGVSRTRIRQVLIRLAGEQLVTLVRNAGARVAEPTPDEAREVFAVRRLVEPSLAEGFIDRASRTELRGLERWIADEERARAAGERHTAIRMAGNFHLHIARHAGNATLERILRDLVSRTSLVLMRFGPQDVTEPGHPGAGTDVGCACHEHRTIAAAIRLRDKGQAALAVSRHLDRLEAQLRFDPPAVASAGLAQLLAG